MNIIETTTQALLAGTPMPLVWALIGWGLALILAFSIWLNRKRQAKTDTALQDAKLELASITAKLVEYDAAQDALVFEREQNTELNKKQAVLEARLQEREKALADLRARLENDFQAIASKMLDTTHQSFLDRANETFLKHEAKQKAETQLHQKTVSELISPMKETLTRYEKGLREMRDNQEKAQGTLSGQIEVC